MGRQAAFDDAFLASMLGGFLDESTALIQTLDLQLCELDKLFQSHPRNAAARIENGRMNEMFRAAHSLKGLSAMLGFEDISRLTHEVENVLDAARNDGLPISRDVVSALSADVDRLAAMVDALQHDDPRTSERDNVARETGNNQQDSAPARIVPIGPLLSRLGRVAHDIAHAKGKAIRVSTAGGTTKVERRLLGKLGEALMHMVRNAADHGVEASHERVTAGKSPIGRITIAVFRSDSHLMVQVRDDGRGLNAQSILAKAMQKGLVTSARAAQLSRSEILQLTWQPGLTTAEQVTAVSGRGMGMDIVKSNTTALGGHVELDSREGSGTTVTVKLPSSAKRACQHLVNHDMNNE